MQVILINSVSLTHILLDLPTMEKRSKENCNWPNIRHFLYAIRGNGYFLSIFFFVLNHSSFNS